MALYWRRTEARRGESGSRRRRASVYPVSSLFGVVHWHFLPLTMTSLPTTLSACWLQEVQAQTRARTVPYESGLGEAVRVELAFPQCVQRTGPRAQWYDRGSGTCDLRGPCNSMLIIVTPDTPARCASIVILVTYDQGAKHAAYEERISA
ncbi:hypothetical protein GGX14DRAFT_389225 [Mycena pura]|uniref:Uncharacterized protein n=1 Tax=Mycena pura TaxID=153505 RepID=A0AAD6VVB9_9AGAR|nr:hypothetical protein GGX14DRAFT_389225 [Mycena pura]